MMKNVLRYLLRHPVSSFLIIIGIILSIKTRSIFPLLLFSVVFGAVTFFVEWLCRGIHKDANGIAEHMKKYKL